jgi:hypothetical protein
MTRLADSCFPNCHPAGAHVGGFQSSGTVALALALLCLFILGAMAVKGK